MSTTIYIDNANCISTDSYTNKKHFILQYEDNIAKLINSSEMERTSYTYNSSGNKQLKMSNNVSSFTIIGSSQTNPLRNLITGVTVSSNVNKLQASCFMNCNNLASAYLDTSCNDIDDYAFYGCTSLSDINCFSDHAFSLENIGQYAFYGCNFTSVHINLSGTNRETGIGQYAFANCKNLVSVSWERSSYMSPNMFNGCDSLTSITLPNYTSYVQENAFENITSLQTIDIPNKIWMLNDYMFKDDTSLSNVTIKDGSTSDTSSVLDQLGTHIFDGCDSLTSLTLPSSITSFAQIDNEFLANSSIKQIVFNGMGDDSFGIKITEQNKISTIDEYGYISKKSHYTAIAEKIVEEQHIPMIVICQKHPFNVYPSDCGHCEDLYKVINSKTWKNYMNENYNRYLFVYLPNLEDKAFWWMFQPTNNKYFKKNPLSAYCDYDYNNFYAQIHLVWIKADGSHIAKSFPQTKTNGKVQNVISSIEEYVKSSTYTFGEDSTIISVDPSIHKLGSPLDSVKFISNTGTEFNVTNSTFEAFLYPTVDKYTTDNFKYGTWYYNAKELKSFADENNLPVLVEFGSKGCTPCKRFMNDIYKNEEFQNWVSSKPYLFCHLEIDAENDESFTDSVNCPEAYFVDYQWARKATNYSSTSIPIIMWYWLKSSGKKIHQVMTYHFTPGQNPPIDADGLMTMTDELFSDAEFDSQFEKTTIEDIYYNSAIVGRKYQNVENDNDGTYYSISGTKTSIDSYSTTIRIDSYVIDSIEVGQSVDFSAGTYQYYIYNAEQTYMKNAHGLIFKVSDSGAVEYLYEYYNETEDNEEPSEFPYELTSLYLNPSEDKLTDMISNAEVYDAKIVIFKLRNDLATSQDVHTKLHSDEFAEAVSSRNVLVIEVYSTTNLNPDSGTEKALKTFIDSPTRTDQVFNAYSIADTPKAYVYQLCMNCQIVNSSGKYVPDIAKEIDITSYTVDQLISILDIVE